MFFCIATVIVVAVQILRHLLCITNCLLLMFRTRVHLFPFLKHRGRPCTDPLYISIGTLEYGYTRCMYSYHIGRLDRYLHQYVIFTRAAIKTVPVVFTYFDCSCTSYFMLGVVFFEIFEVSIPCGFVASKFVAVCHARGGIAF